MDPDQWKQSGAADHYFVAPGVRNSTALGIETKTPATLFWNRTLVLDWEGGASYLVACAFQGELHGVDNGINIVLRFRDAQGRLISGGTTYIDKRLFAPWCNMLGYIDTRGTWQEYRWVVEVPEGTATVDVHLGAMSASGRVLFDDLRIVKVASAEERKAFYDQRLQRAQQRVSEDLTKIIRNANTFREKTLAYYEESRNRAEDKFRQVVAILDQWITPQLQGQTLDGSANHGNFRAGTTMWDYRTSAELSYVLSVLYNLPESKFYQDQRVLEALKAAGEFIAKGFLPRGDVPGHPNDSYKDENVNRFTLCAWVDAYIMIAPWLSEEEHIQWLTSFFLGAEYQLEQYALRPVYYPNMDAAFTLCVGLIGSLFEEPVWQRAAAYRGEGLRDFIRPQGAYEYMAQWNPVPVYQDVTVMYLGRYWRLLEEESIGDQLAQTRDYYPTFCEVSGFLSNGLNTHWKQPAYPEEQGWEYYVHPAGPELIAYLTDCPYNAYIAQLNLSRANGYWGALMLQWLTDLAPEAPLDIPVSPSPDIQGFLTKSEGFSGYITGADEPRFNFATAVVVESNRASQFLGTWYQFQHQGRTYALHTHHRQISQNVGEQLAVQHTVSTLQYNTSGLPQVAPVTIQETWILGQDFLIGCDWVEFTEDCPGSELILAYRFNQGATSLSPNAGKISFRYGGLAAELRADARWDRNFERGFVVDLAPGSYRLDVYTANFQFRREPVDVFVNGIPVGRIEGGEMGEKTVESFDVVIEEGQLRLSFHEERSWGVALVGLGLYRQDTQEMVYQFDFTQGSGAAVSGWIPVPGTTVYNPTRGYGWTEDVGRYVRTSGEGGIWGTWVYIPFLRNLTIPVLSITDPETKARLSASIVVVPFQNRERLPELVVKEQEELLGFVLEGEYVVVNRSNQEIGIKEALQRLYPDLSVTTEGTIAPFGTLILKEGLE